MSVTRRVLDALLDSPASKRRVQFDQSISGRRMAGNRFRWDRYGAETSVQREHARCLKGYLARE
jgi:hypothetical protein